MTGKEALVWHCLRAQLLLDLTERNKESFETFPKPMGKSGETEIVSPLIERVADGLSKGSLAPIKLQQRAANTTLLLTARYIPEYARTFAGDERRQKLRWLLDRTAQLETIETWFERRTEQSHESNHLLRSDISMCKMYLATKLNRQFERAKSFLRDAIERAEKDGDTTSARTIADTLQWAAEKVVGASV